MLRAYEAKRGFKGVGGEWKGIQKTLPTTHVDPLRLTFAYNQVKLRLHRTGSQGRVRHARVKSGEILFAEISDVADIFSLIARFHQAAHKRAIG